MNPEALSSDDLGKYVLVFPDCIPVEGPVSSAIYDLTRGRISTFPSAYLPFFAQFRVEPLGQIVDALSDEDRRAFSDFFAFLLRSEYITLVEDLSAFPELATTWDEPGVVRDAILDVDGRHHDYAKIIGELDGLGCLHLQVRGYSELFGITELAELARLCHGTSIQSLEAVLRHEPARSDDSYAAVVGEHRIISSLVLHSASSDGRIAVDYGARGPSAALVTTEIERTTKRLGSHLDCGTITKRQLLRPSTVTFAELQRFNGCLNRKIAIDADGELRNCPAMAASFGHHRSASLGEVARRPAFQQAWHAKKDDIEGCRDCQFRYACTDCRAFVEDPNAADSKPLKCGYDPYSDTWTDWRMRVNATAMERRYRERMRLPIVTQDDAAMGSRG
jgi:SPASM domain peptide maturase of grasp-with-spasm system